MAFGDQNLHLQSPQAPVLVGPSGWQHPHWEGTIYPAGRAHGFHPLHYIAGKFDAVEVTQTFSTIHRPEVAKLWVNQVQRNPRFQFAVRMHKQFTHERNLDPVIAAAFCDAIRPLKTAGRLGALLLTFPWSFRFTAENRQYLIQLRRTFTEFPMVVEMRHSSWLCAEALGTLIDFRLGFANLDQPEHIKAMPPTSYLTSPIGYVRLHGKRRRDWYLDFAEDFPPAGKGYAYSPAELDAWQARVEELRQYSRQTFVFFTDSANGQSFWNALEMGKRFGLPKIGARRPVATADQKMPAAQKTAADHLTPNSSATPNPNAASNTAPNAASNTAPLLPFPEAEPARPRPLAWSAAS